MATEILTHHVKLLMGKSIINPFKLFHLSGYGNSYLVHKGKLFKNDSYNVASASSIKFSELPKGQIFKCVEITDKKIYSF